MTNERAVEILNLDLDILGQYGGESAEAYKMAIQALDAQPCEDCISREAVIRLVDQYPNIIGNRCSGLIADIKHLPSVTSQASEEDIHREREQAYMHGYEDASKKFRTEPSENCISREAVLEGLANIAKVKAKSDAQKSMMGRCMFFVEQLPPVQPQRKRGKWIITFPGGAKAFKCNRCNKYADICHASDYCPNCGAEMED